MRRRIFGRDHEDFRGTADAFFRRERENLDTWTSEGRVDRGFFERAGELGLLGLRVPEEYGGSDAGTYTFNVVLSEAAAAANVSLVGLRVHAEVVLPYLLKYGTPEQRARWVPAMVAGTTVGAIAMSEADTGSDLAGIATRAARNADGDFVLSGAKTFITNGTNADLVVVVARTGSGGDRRAGLSLLVVEDGMPGFTRGNPVGKLGLKYSDTAELSFDDVVVPGGNLLGEEGRGFEYLTSNLPQERISIAVGAIAMSQAALRRTIEYARDRQLFGTSLASLQNTRFVLAEVAAEIETAQQALDNAVVELDEGTLSPEDAAKIKLVATEVQARTVDKCLQVHGGYGYMTEYDIAAMYADARVTRIYGGSSEVMKVIISRSLGLGASR
ncbi:acyl-CoA dehydrogenase family protein [Micromonospora sp. HUAS LYJ1]|uniref:acyl-CoA dehydrogenase family protein n=1 Tax=Micromonospora sp. HUAS LYJ1 TaxID=3061626 RepID=UPI002671B598|nr:acyl-CoA dehydrogenase family protein [Micromonospora sp. HUAS LYJ1]WKU03538.1 acyl-CoA dehydrogenase family protein [Micromonospora sp. HUAS LYJ1]